MWWQGDGLFKRSYSGISPKWIIICIKLTVSSQYSLICFSVCEIYYPRWYTKEAFPRCCDFETKTEKNRISNVCFLPPDLWIQPFFRVVILWCELLFFWSHYASVPFMAGFCMEPHHCAPPYTVQHARTKTTHWYVALLILVLCTQRRKSWNMVSVMYHCILNYTL